MATARSLSVPRLVLQGGWDYQVPLDTEFSRWRDALDGDSVVTLRSYSALTHLLIPGEGTPGQASTCDPATSVRRSCPILPGG